MARRTFGTIRKMPSSGKFQARYSHLGRKYKARHTFLSRGDASRYLAGVETSISKGTWIDPDAIVAPPESHLFGPYATAWVAGRNLTARTTDLYLGLLRELMPVFAHQEIAAIQPRQVREWFEGLPRDRATRNTHLYSLLRTILGTAVKDRIIEISPCAVVIPRVKPRKSVVVLKPAEVYALADALPDRLKAMALVTAFGCLRYGEVTELRRGDYADGVLHVRRGVTWLKGKPIVGEPKTEAGKRDVPLLPSLRPILAEHMMKYAGPGEDGLLFPSITGGHLSHNALTAVLQEAKEALGKPGLTWHHLRHTGAVMWAQVPGVTLKDLMTLLGHSTPTMALHYQHVAEGKLEDVAKRLDARLKGLDEDDEGEAGLVPAI